eukprot:3144488-Rhodomonas_salina.1
MGEASAEPAPSPTNCPVSVPWKRTELAMAAADQDQTYVDAWAALPLPRPALTCPQSWLPLEQPRPEE